MAEEKKAVVPTESDAKKKTWVRKLVFTVLVILLFVCITVAAFTSVGIIYLVDEDIPWMNEDKVERLLANMQKEGELETELASYLADMLYQGESGERIMTDIMGSFLADKILHLALDQSFDEANAFSERLEVDYVIYHPYGRPLGGTIPMAETTDAVRHSVPYTNEETGERINYTVYLSFDLEKIQAVLTENYEVRSYWVRYRGPIMLGFVVSVLLSLCLLVATCNMITRKAPETERLADKPPIGLMLLCVCILEFLLWKPFRKFLVDLISWQANDMVVFGATCIWISMVALALGFIYFLAWRLKHPGWHRRTLCCLAIKGLRKLILGWVNIFRNLRIVWKALLIELVVTALEALIIVLALLYDQNMLRLLIAFLVLKLILIPFILRYFIALGKVEKALSEVAGGNLETSMDLERLPGPLQGFGKDINAMAGTVSNAVEERMRSEKLKTELITNVSHDIKTPLTSIINFSDLIEKEETGNEKVKEYASHLHAQSSKLKKLIEDLIEASKASTGNLEAHPEICDVQVLLGQCLGEYETRLSERSLELVLKQSPEPLRIMADTRMLWRVFDNLMANVCKYSQENTRVYLSAEKKQDKAVILFKNVSKYALDVSPEELMERFVRGDLSRHSEGHGLGLSIARSLMELQGGTIAVDVDADLFKVMLEFPLVSES